MLLKRLPSIFTPVFGLVCMAVSAQAQQISAPGYVGAINTPIALSMAQGSVAVSVTNSTPELRRVYPDVGSFGGINVGFGLLPGLDAVGRLTYDGDLNCDTYSGNCPATTRDLSVGAKWQLPIEQFWPRSYFFKPHLAVGVTDYGGAATHYRQKYAVATVEAGPFMVSAGKSVSEKSVFGGSGLMNGTFGSLILKLTDEVSLLAENDTKELRAGLSWTHKVSPSMDLTVAMSKKFTDKSVQQSAQATLGLSYYFGRGARAAAAERFSIPQPMAAQASVMDGSSAQQDAAPRVEISPAQVLPQQEPTEPTETAQDTAQRVADVFKAMGFSDIDVAKTPLGWMVQAEPRLWRQDRMDALGAGLAAFVSSGLGSESTLVLALTYMGQRVGGVQTTDSCARRFIEGQDRCDGQAAMEFFFDLDTVAQEQGAQWLVLDANNKRFMPQFEISPAASYTAGTEFGLVDYSVGVTGGWEVPLAKGLQWQGFNAHLLSETDDFKNPNSYFRRVGLGEATRPATNLLIYQSPIVPRLWAQLAVGNLSYKTSGAQINTYWASRDGSYRATWIYGRWDNPYVRYQRQPNILSFGVRPFSPNWQITYSTGQFQGNDTGHRLASSHYFYDYAIQLYARKTGPSNLLPNNNAYMGFSITFPLGPNKAAEVGPVTVRARDRWELGLETKILQPDNYIEPGYGSFPGIRHSLDTDVFDFNRADLGLMGMNSFKMRLNARRALRDYANAKNP
jgi:hypothetical protein